MHGTVVELSGCSRVARWHQMVHSIPKFALLHFCRTHLHCVILAYMAVLLRGLTATLQQHSQPTVPQMKVDCLTICAVLQVSGLPGVWGLVSRTQVPPGHRQPCPLTQASVPGMVHTRARPQQALRGPGAEVRLPWRSSLIKLLTWSTANAANSRGLCCCLHYRIAALRWRPLRHNEGQHAC